MKTWANGAKGSYVKEIIDSNFTSLEESIKTLGNPYVKDFTTSDWSLGMIFIKLEEYNKANPIVQLYIKQDDAYCVVFGGYRVTNSGIELLSDINYEGRVVIK